LRDTEATRDNAVASEKTATAGAAERGLSDATQRVATLEKDLSASKEAAESGRRRDPEGA
jgi:hypothetical protein